MAIFGKKRASGVRFTKRSSLTVNERLRIETISWSSFVKWGLVLLCTIFVLFIVINWQNVLNSLDKSPIRAYALTHKTQFTTNADIRDALAKEPILKGYFGQDIQEVKDKLLAISWVRDVVVRKFYPDRLGLTILEHQPIAIWNKEQFLSERGDIFSLPADRFDKTGLPILAGPDSESKKVLEAWRKIQLDLKARQLTLKSLAMDNRSSWSVVLDNDVEIRLGRGEWIPKIDRFVSMFSEIEIPEGQRLDYVDMRYEHGVAVGFRPIQK